MSPPFPQSTCHDEEACAIVPSMGKIRPTTWRPIPESTERAALLPMKPNGLVVWFLPGLAWRTYHSLRVMITRAGVIVVPDYVPSEGGGLRPTGRRGSFVMRGHGGGRDGKVRTCVAFVGSPFLSRDCYAVNTQAI